MFWAAPSALFHGRGRQEIGGCGSDPGKRWEAAEQEVGLKCLRIEDLLLNLDVEEKEGFVGTQVIT